MPACIIKNIFGQSRALWFQDHGDMNPCFDENGEPYDGYTSTWRLNGRVYLSQTDKRLVENGLAPRVRKDLETLEAAFIANLIHPSKVDEAVQKLFEYKAIPWREFIGKGIY